MCSFPFLARIAIIFLWTRKLVMRRFPSRTRHAGLDSIDSIGEMRAVLSAMGGWDESHEREAASAVSGWRGGRPQGRGRERQLQRRRERQRARELADTLKVDEPEVLQVEREPEYLDVGLQSSVYRRATSLPPHRLLRDTANERDSASEAPYATAQRDAAGGITRHSTPEPASPVSETKADRASHVTYAPSPKRSPRGRTLPKTQDKIRDHDQTILRHRELKARPKRRTPRRMESGDSYAADHSEIEHDGKGRERPWDSARSRRCEGAVEGQAEELAC